MPRGVHEDSMLNRKRETTMSHLFRIRLSSFAGALLVPVLAAAAEHAEEGEVAAHFGVPDTIWKSINLVLFFGLLIWLVAKPIGSALRKRREAIAADLAEAARKREETSRTEEEIRRRIAALEAEVDDFSKKAKEDGERERAELATRGETEAERILVQAREEVETQVLAARRELAAFAGELAAELAEKMIASKLDAAGRKAFLDQAIDEIGKVRSTR